MIYIKDNFLPEIILNKLEEYLIDFREVEAGDKKFWIMETPIDFQEWIVKKLELLENRLHI